MDTIIYQLGPSRWRNSPGETRKWTGTRRDHLWILFFRDAVARQSSLAGPRLKIHLSSVRSPPPLRVKQWEHYQFLSRCLVRYHLNHHTSTSQPGETKSLLFESLPQEDISRRTVLWNHEGAAGHAGNRAEGNRHEFLKGVDDTERPSHSHHSPFWPSAVGWPGMTFSRRSR